MSSRARAALARQPGARVLQGPSRVFEAGIDLQGLYQEGEALPHIFVGGSNSPVNLLVPVEVKGDITLDLTPSNSIWPFPS